MNLTDQTLEHWIELSQKIATTAHEGQKRTNGRPYIEHPARIAAAVEPRLKPIAWLHDVVEDTGVTLDALRKQGFPSYIIEAVDLLTHKNKEPNVVYWKRILTNPDAATVKLADIKDNMGETPSEHAKQKYEKALALFKQAGYL